jgi:CRISPR system Cascade subunit CasE
MYLSRVEINIRLQATRRALASPQILHATVKACFPASSDRVLWRLDQLGHATYLLVVSRHAPDFRHLIEQFGWPNSSQPVTIHAYDDFLQRLAVDQIWHFRLTANPTHTVNGKVCAHLTINHQKQWLSQQAKKHGFALEDHQFDILRRDRARFHRGNELVTLSICEFEGLLTITDVQLFRTLLTTGLGRAKAYGCGLLTVMKSKK